MPFQLPIGSIIVPFCGLYLGSYTVNPKWHNNGADGYVSQISTDDDVDSSTILSSEATLGGASLYRGFINHYLYYFPGFLVKLVEIIHPKKNKNTF